MNTLIYQPSQIDRLRTLTTNLSHEEDLLLRLAEECPDMLCVIDDTRHLAYVSHACQHVLETAPEELIDHYFYTLIYPDDIKITTKILNALELSKITRFCSRCITKFGNVVQMEWMAVLSTDGNIYASARFMPD